MAQIVALASPQYVPRILLIEDSPGDALLIEKSIAKTMQNHCIFCHEPTLEAGLKALAEKEFDVVLLDLSLPDTTGFEGLLAIQTQAPKLPVIMLTAYADEEMALGAVEHGAQDYLFKDKASGDSIRRAMQYAVQRKQFEAMLITQANFDALTGLANRTLFESRLDMALARMRRSNMGLGIFFLDLNRFKQVNDALGHAAGDEILRQVAQRLAQCIRPYDTAARFGGDEFALLVEGIPHARDCAVIAQKILNQIAEPFTLMSKKADIGVSIGIATCFSHEHVRRDLLMKHADEAMYGAKFSVVSNYRFYTPEIHEEACARLKLEGELRSVIVNNELTLHYQPKINLHDGTTSSLEALARWNHPSRGLILPGEFMVVARETGLSGAIGDWVLAAVCSDMARWEKAGFAGVPVSINLCPSQLDDRSFLDTLRECLDKYQISATMLAVEVPSSALLENMEERIALLGEIHAFGVAVHLDHFGTAQISLATLMSLPLDAIKIAPELTRTLGEPKGMLTLVQTIMDIAGRFDVDVVATGIENEWQKAFFKENHCREGQGYGLCRPLAGESIPDWLTKGNV